MATWEHRFRAPTHTFPVWARHAPDRLVVATNETGTYQVYAWDRARATRTKITDLAVGVLGGVPTPDGSAIAWFDDATGDETGIWVRSDFDHPDEDAPPLAAGVPNGWQAGLAIGETRIAIGIADDTGYAVYLDNERIHHHPDVVHVAGLSRDDTLLSIEHSEHGDSAHRALRVLDTKTDKPVADLWDGEGFGLDAAGWSPVAGDQRLAIVSERNGPQQAGVWNVTTGERHDIELREPGDVRVAGWWPDASALLLVRTHHGRDQLLKHDLATEHTTALDHPAGSITGARVRPDGDVWYLHSSGATPPTLRATDTDGPLLTLEGDRAPDGYPYRSWYFENPKGQEVHGFVVSPEGDPPHPLVMLVHGGPAWLWADAWRAEVPAWVDHGFAVALVNYRGSTGYGREWRDALLGDPGFPEVEDLVAGLDDLVASKQIDAQKVILAGGSWGGYLTLLGLGLHPDRWAAGVAVVPVADYLAAYEDEAPGLKSLDRMLFGGAPDEVPDLYQERSPITYADRVNAPVLVIAGDNDTRCPIRQILNYLDRLQQLGKPHEVYRYEAGHGSLVIEERVKQMAMELDFVMQRVR